MIDFEVDDRVSMVEKVYKILDHKGWLDRLEDVYNVSELGKETINNMLEPYPKALREEYRQQFWDACHQLYENRDKPISIKLEQSNAIAVHSEVVTDDDLSGIERAAFQYAETQIEKGLQSFVEIGTALKQIQENKLYRADYSTFENYLETRWGMSREQGYRNISAATVAQNLLPIGNIPTAESQVRLLSPLPEEQQREVWRDAISRTVTGAPTAATVAMVLAERGLKVPKSALPKSGFTEPNRDSDELYTPFEFLQSVYYCLGEIDLDPCSNSLEEPNVKAKSHYTKAIDGLAFQRIWAGKIFMNPPYNAPKPWVERLLEEHAVGEVEEAICLLPVDPSTAWWQALIDHPVCLISRRLQFVGGTSSARFASAAFYLGNDLPKFHNLFKGWGEIRQTVEPGMFGE